MADNIYTKLSKVREAVKKEDCSSYGDMLDVVNKKLKTYKLLPLYCFYGDVATLSIVDMDEITMVLKFQIPVGLVDVKNIKEYLYRMAFELDDNFNNPITAKQYLELVERMTRLRVKESEITERYKINSLEDMTIDTYKRCMAALDKTKRQQN